MAFELKSVVPWGRNLEEYRLMFSLTKEDLAKNIISFGDGPASFNAEMTSLGYQVTSLDPIYQFSKEELHQRIQVTSKEIITQLKSNQENFVWTHIKDVAQLEKIRMQAMERFLEDFELGKRQGRYITHALPESTTYAEGSFMLGLSSHFLILYAKLGLDFHIQSIQEMLRVCKEIRIFPLLDLDAKESRVLQGIIDSFQEKYIVSIEQVKYEFQRNGNKMLRIVQRNII